MKELIIDDREPQALIDRISARGFNISKERLGVGDYVWDDICIERKTLKDFLNSMNKEKKEGRVEKTPRIWRQAQGMVENFNHNIIIIHGLPKDLDKPKRYNSRRIRGVVAGLENGFGIFVENVLNEDEFIHSLTSHYQRGSKELNRPYPSTPPSTPVKEKIENALCQAERIGVKTAKNILKDYGSLKSIANAGLGELQSKYGEKTGLHIWELLCEELKYET